MRRGKSHLNNKGFSLIMALIAVAILGAISMAVTALFNTFNAQSRHFSSVVGARALMSTLQGFISYPNLCIANLDPASRNFNPTQAATDTGIPLIIQLGSATVPKVEAGSTLRNYDVVVDYLIYKNAAVTGADPLVAGNLLYSGELVLKLKKSGAANMVSGGNELRERGVGTMILSVNAANQVTGCRALADARLACSQVGGTYDDTATPKCKLPYPCAVNSVFMGYDSSMTAQCKTMSQIVGSACPTAGQYLVSDGAGGTICRAP